MAAALLYLKIPKTRATYNEFFESILGFVHALHNCGSHGIAAAATQTAASVAAEHTTAV